MKVLAVNGSPRKTWNTATMLSKALEGAASQGAEIELIHLNALTFKGCQSCFACKTREGKSYGKCAVEDDLTPVFERVKGVNAIILGSPIYFGTVTGLMRSFMERLMYPYLTSTNPPQSLFPKKINTAFIYTMNRTEEQMKEMGWDRHLGLNERVLRMLFGASESLFSFDTMHVEDYSKIVADAVDTAKKAETRKEVFPLDCEKAFEMGAKFTTESK